MAIVVSKLTSGANSHLTTAEEGNGMYTDFVSEGFIGALANTSGVAPATGAFAINAQGTPDATVAYSAGVAYVTGTPTSQNSQTFRVYNSASANLTISANSSGSTKYDWIYISLDATKLNAPNTAGDDVATVVASRSSSASADDGTPPTYGVVIAVVTVANGFTTISNSNIRDARVQSTISATAAGTSQDWYSLGAVPSSVTYNGNRSYTCLFSATDLTDTVSNGMRLKMTRTVTAPTQCTDLETSSSQYWSKTSPAGTTFTDDFNCGAWIKLESYGAYSIVSRYNGTSGWDFQVNANGQVRFVGVNAGAANTSEVVSYQSVPLNKWVHVAAQLDMSAFTATTTTSYIMIDGVNVPANVVRAGTNPTALIQAGNLEVGSRNGGLQPFDGKLAQVWYSSAKITQATIQGFISQTMTGSETSIVSLFKFNGDGNDSNANANNLTAQGSALATATDTPFAGGSVGTTEYGIITANTFSTNTTLTVQVPEGYAIPTSGGVSAVSYSTQSVPYGFPRDRGKWRVSSLLKTDSSCTSNATYGSFLSGGYALVVPPGTWEVGHRGGYTNSSTTTVYWCISKTALTGLTINTANDITPFTHFTKSAAAANATFYAVVSMPQDLTTQSTYVMYTVGATTSSLIAGGSTNAEIFAEFAYL